MSNLLEKVLSLLPAYKYHGLAPAPSDGKQRDTFTVNQGSNGRTRTFRVKVDKPDLEGRLADLAARGYNTSGEIQNMLGIPTDEAIRNHISPVTDFYVGDDGTFVSLEPEFEGAVTLRKFVEDKGGKLDKETFNNIFPQILKAQQAAINQYHLLHRDLHPGNILINPSTLEVRITDFTNATSSKNTHVKPMHTSGATYMRDPMLDKRFTGQERAYGPDNEMYSLGVLALQLLTGKNAVSYDFEKGTAIDTRTGESLLDENGRVIPWKHEGAFVGATLKIPNDLSGHSLWIRGVTSLSPKPKSSYPRFSSIDELVEHVGKVTKPSLWERIKGNKSVVAAATLTTLVLGGGTSGTAWYFDRQEQEARVLEAEKYVVTSYWNGKGMEISNDKIDLRFSLNLSEQWYPTKNNILRAKAGDSLSITPTARAQIEDVEGFGTNTTISLMGRYYIEGYPFADGSIARTFHVWTEGLNEGTNSYGYGGYFGAGRDANIPQLSDGVYHIAVELYAPTNEEINNSKDSNLRKAKLRFAEPGKAIVRKKVPLIIGNPKQPIDVYIANAQFCDENWSARTIKDDLPSDGWGYSLPPRDSFYVESFSPEVSFREIFQGDGRLPPMANFKDATQANIYYALRNNDGQIIHFTGMPLKKDYLRGPYLERESPHYYITFGSVGEDFAEKLVEARKSIPNQVEAAALKKN